MHEITLDLLTPAKQYIFLGKVLGFFYTTILVYRFDPQHFDPVLESKPTKQLTDIFVGGRMNTH